MTTEGKVYVVGLCTLAGVALIVFFWQVLLWIGGSLVLLLALIMCWRLRRGRQRRRLEARKSEAELSMLEAQTEQAWIDVEASKARVAQQQALAEQYRAQAAALWVQRRMIPEQMVGVLLDHPAQRELVHVWPQPSTITYNGMEAPALPASAPLAALPQAHVWEEIEPGVGPNRFHLGTVLDEQGRNTPLWVPLDGVITLVSIGPQGLGKTTLARSLALQQVIQGGDVAICDWYNDIAAEMSAFFPHCYSEPEDCERYAETVLMPAMAQRHAEYKAGRRDFPALLWLIDEWAMLKKDCPAMAEALINAFTVWRKLGLRTIVSSVALDTRDLGVSKSAVSTLALFSGNENLARTWGLSGIKPQLDLLYKSGKGYCLITSQHLQRQADLFALSNVSSPLFRSVVERTRPELAGRTEALPELPPLPKRGESRELGESARIVPIRPSQDSPSPTSAKMPLTKWEREFIKVRYRKGAQRTEIRDELRELRKDGFDNRLWPELKAICDTIDLEEADA